ncbi:serine/threonine-protein kinase [Nocardioides bizhenqiangii]|uniref:Protein kinase domain-containing protein n=1 Tax=Nocardioides bizhenqiangii TaxID=3095076 RepID=A0ABZ0ZRZ1_9ACTN|nr:hypothetical protein [Nocardioides sp. HM61]WQQ27100.1 hypothetical protein SHK19_02465 [Nocardioides sp. HM61]
MTVLEMSHYGCNTLRRLRREARLIDPTWTPDLAPAFEIDRCAATPTLMTGDLPDLTLDDLVSISPLPAAAALHALRDVAATLEAMHDRGLAHGDVRPSTVFILPDGRSALARPRAADREPDRPTDAHDFAVLAFELLTGVHPLLPRDAVAMASSLPMLPRAAADVLELTLTIDPDRRPLPHALMVALDAIPAEDWPTNGLHRPPSQPPAPAPVATTPPLSPPERPAPARLAPPVEPASAEPPPAEEPPADERPVPDRPVGPRPIEVRIVPPPVRRSLFRRILGPFVIFLGLTTVFTGGAAGAWLLFAPSPSASDPAADPPHVRRISLSVTPPQALCPYAALHVTATIVADGGPGDLELRWRLPDGSDADPQSFTVDGGRTVLRAAIDLTLTGREQLIGEVVAVVNGARASAPIRYLCPGAVDDQRDRSRAI